MTERDMRSIKCSHPSWEHLSTKEKEKLWVKWSSIRSGYSDGTFNDWVNENPTDEMILINRDLSINEL